MYQLSFFENYRNAFSFARSNKKHKWQSKNNSTKGITDSRRVEGTDRYVSGSKRAFREIRSNGGSASTRLCIGPYMVASRMAVYRKSLKEAEYATVEHVGVLYVSAC